MQIISSFPLIDTLLAPHAEALGGDATAYRHHIHRVLNFFVMLSGEGRSVPEAVLVAAAFHDLGIWTARTFDYLAPSVALAAAHLREHGHEAWLGEVSALIVEHHKLTRYTGPHADTVEVFRQADLVDVSLGLIRHGLPRDFVRSVQVAFPNAGFHARLVALTLRQLGRTPWRPLPMVHW